jgi:glycosyltransferase involved in cell wall biosynthesis
MLQSPKLSVCIATLNRATFLAATLQSITAQVTDEIEIVVVDGASTDNTVEVIATAQKRFPNIRYLRLDEKGGVDRDYSRAVELAQGEYCWLFSDDDILKPGAIRTILEAIHDQHGLIIVNAECRNSDLSQVIETRRLSANERRVYACHENEQFFIDVAYYMSFIGGIVIRRDIWNNREKEKYFGTSFIHIGVIFQRPFDFDVLVIAEPLIAIRLGNAEWSSRAFEIWMFKWPALIWSFSHYSHAARGSVVKREPWRKLTALLRYRARGTYTLTMYNQLLKPRLTPSWKSFVARLIALTPECFANMIGLLYYSVVHYSPVELLDLRLSRSYYRNCIARLFKGSN